MITTHILDIGRGGPAVRVPVELDFFITGQGWRSIGRGVTDDDGRIEDFGEPAAAGIYRLVFDVAAFLPDAFFPSVTITFEVREPAEFYHVPLVMSPYGYSTYRGS